MFNRAESVTILGSTLIRERQRIDAGEAAWLLELAEFHQRGDWALDGCRDTKHWLRYFCGMSAPTAKEKLRVGLALQQHPSVYDAFAEGRVSYCQVRAITRYRGNDPDVMSALLTAAESGATVADLERLVRHDRLLHEQDHEPDGELAEWERVGLRARHQYDGLGTIELTMRPDDMARILAMVDAKLQHDFYDRKEGAVDSRESTGDPVTGEQVTWAERRLHALLDLLAAGVVKLGEEGDIDVEHATMNVMIDYDRLYRDANRGACETAQGIPLSNEAARRLACDAGYHRIITKGRSLILDVGAKTRMWNSAQRRAVRTKYGHQCGIPSCHTRITQIHHIVAVGAGGETNIIFAIPLCSWHHHLVHEGGWWITVDTITGIATLNSPDGRTIELPTYTYTLFTDTGDNGGLAS